jgi:hypothetical protein
MLELVIVYGHSRICYSSQKRYISLTAISMIENNDLLIVKDPTFRPFLHIKHQKIRIEVTMMGYQ